MNARSVFWLSVAVGIGVMIGVAVRSTGHETGVIAPIAGGSPEVRQEPLPRRIGPGPASGAPRVTPSVARTGTGSFTTIDAGTPVRGEAGRLEKYRVAVEKGSGQDLAEFAQAVDRTLTDYRGWTAGGELRLQRVPDGESADFTIYLATPVTSERMCATGGLRTEQFASCRLSGKVIINLARWVGSVPNYKAPVGVYRDYVINHEVGHELGYGHESCPGPGKPAPVMQQQTYGLSGCVANGWPYVDGKRYRGPTVLGG
ncbi:lipoprotein [Virgisporangium aliadipatigenens]|uniref:Lipoprotein n=1 Tax=Virgisporangium aliadipatigenens TaxID=741659 RepID=A0A8J3YI34_9ACTN|nr:DUF3152 domain-containing protein [Virgisporangium aliadipatigenens]GIJ44613.1 lipoprotein [Virgisporangium aliadipatigenens]